MKRFIAVVILCLLTRHPLCLVGMQQEKLSPSSGVAAVVSEKSKLTPLEKVVQAVAQKTDETSQQIQATLESFRDREDYEKIIQQVSVQRFNLQSPWYGARFLGKWNEDPWGAIVFLSQGVYTAHQLDPYGRLELKEPPSFIPKGEITVYGLEGQIYRSKPGNLQVQLEWAWFPWMESWLPVSVFVVDREESPRNPSMLKVIINDRKEVIRMGVQLKNSDLAEGHFLYSRVSPSGKISLGAQLLPSQRWKGSYDFPSQSGELFRVLIGGEGSIIHFHFAGDSEPRSLQRIVTRKDDGSIERVWESQVYFTSERIKEITEEAGIFWMIGLRVLPGDKEKKLAPLNVSDWHITQEVDYTLAQVYYLPLDYAGQPAEVLLADGIPSYIHVQDKKGVPEIKEFLKRIEIRQQEKILEVIASYYSNVPQKTIAIASRRAIKLKGEVVITNIVVSQRQGTTALVATVSGRDIYIPAGLTKDLPENGIWSAEVVCDPSRSKVTPHPVEIRLGYYTNDDPLRFSERKFVVVKSYSFKSHSNKDNKNTFVADPSQGGVTSPMIVESSSEASL